MMRFQAIRFLLDRLQQFPPCRPVEGFVLFQERAGRSRHDRQG